VTFSQCRVEFLERNSDHQVTPDDPTAHARLTQKGEAAKHLSFSDVPPIAQDSADAVRELFVVRHRNRRIR
jgi:hypothetical protein